ncbi:hypothetical protein BD410DRAFT_780721 [Rickenella mellea]|uniref:F-box domain-containing protein n=1 Tax=Rickenella mellea TaxID=50990 RepID=A0A4R5XG75_9AGAM|nr:hypothetical protein BD410DRAFT_780721 [Rickenella mellea]
MLDSKIIELATIDNLIGILTRIRANGGILGDILLDPTRDSEDASGHEARLATLRILKASRNAQQLILKATEKEIYRLKEETSATILQRGIQSLPDDLVREIFYAGFNLYGCSLGSESYPFKLSHVNRRFRTIALETPRIWTRLSNASSSAQLGYRIERSKAAWLNICVMAFGGADDYPCSVAEFLEIATPLSSRWESFEYVVRIPETTEYGTSYTYRALLYYPNVDAPHLTSFTWQIRYNEVTPESLGPPATFFKHWNMPRLTHFDGLNVSIDAALFGSNLVSVTLEFESEYVTWDADEFDDTLGALASSTCLKHLSLKFAEDDFDHGNKVPITLLASLVALNIAFSATPTRDFVTRFFTAVQMPMLTSMSVTVAIDDQTIGETIYGQHYTAIISSARHYPNLQKFALDFTGSQTPPAWNVIATFGQMLPSLQEVTLGGAGAWINFGRLTSPVSWRLFRLRASHKLTYDGLCRMAATDPGWGSCKIDIPDERNLSTEAICLLGDRLIYESCIS